MSVSLRTTHYYQRFREEYKRRNALELCSFLIGSAVKKVYESNDATWLHLCLNYPIPSITGKLPATFGFLTLSEARNYFLSRHPVFPWMYIEQEMDAAEQNDHIFPCLLMDNSIVAYMKIGISKVFILDFKQVLHLPPNAALMYDSFVEPALRSRGLGSALAAATARYLQEKKFESMWAQVAPWNIASRKMLQSVGFTPIGDIRYVRLFRKKMFSTRPRNFPLVYSSDGKGRTLKISSSPTANKRVRIPQKVET